MAANTSTPSLGLRSKTYDVVTFGEAMIRLSPAGHQRLEQSTALEVAVGGAELSVAAGVSRLGLRSAWVSRLPDNPLGRMIANQGRLFDVDLDHVIWVEDERVGLYFVEYGASPRPTHVIYDREGSAMASIQPGMVDWETILKQTRIFHVGGITPALSRSADAAQKEALQFARTTECLVSCDLNYRALLWTLEEAHAAQVQLMDYVDVLITSLPDQPQISELISGLSDEDPANIAEKLVERFGFRVVLITMPGTPSFRRSTWTSLAYADGQVFNDRTYEIEVVDRLGGGDACVAGFFTGLLQGDIAYGVRLGNAFSALKQTSPTDWPWPTLAEAEALITSGESQITR